jgi:signal transduction histidine kinase
VARAWRASGPGLAVRLTVAVALAVVPTITAAFWTVEQVTVRKLQSQIDADLLTQLREWHRWDDARAPATPGQLETAATGWLEQQRDHPSTQVQVIEVSGGLLISNHPGVLAEEVAREAAEGNLPPSARDRPLPGLLDIRAGLTTASTQDAGPVRVVSEPIVRGGQVLGVVRVADSLQPVTRARDQLRRTFWTVGALAVVATAALTAAATTVLTRPLRRLSTVAAAVDAGRLGLRAQLARGPGDLVALGRSFDRMLDRLQRAFQRQREFAGEISHDLRTPLTIARAQAELLRAADDAERRREGVRVVLAQIDAVDRLVADLLTLALAEERAPIRTHWIEVADLLADLRLELPLLGDRRYEVGGCPGAVRADPDQLGRVLRNLASNAVRHTEAGGRITVTATPRGDRLQLCVDDDGPGIAPDDLERVFERFHTTPRDRSGGAGLGLPIARALVEAHGGRIWAESQPGRGAHFHVELPHYRP